MAQIVGGITTSHIPAIGNASTNKLQDEPYWKLFFEGYPPVHKWLDKAQPDVAVVMYNDHGLNFFLDKMPTFAIGAAAEYQNADEGWGLKPLAPFPGDPDLSRGIIESLVADEFDLMCMDKIVNDPEALTRYSMHDIIRNAGAQGAELVLWLTMRGALSEKVMKVHSNYHIPISNTASGLLVLENAA